MTRALLVICLVGCATGPGPDVSLRKGEVEMMRDEAAALWKQQRDLEWQAYTRGITVDIAETYRGHEKLFSKETSERLLKEMNTTPDKSRQRGLRYLRRHILWELVGFETSKSQDELDTLKQSASITLGAQTMSINELQAAQARESDPVKRRQLQEAAAQIYDRLSAAYLKLDREVTGATRLLDFFNYMELSDELRLVDLADVGRICEAFMADTDAMYLVAVKKIVPQELGFDFEKMTLSDLPRLIRSPRYDQWLPEDNEMAVLGATLKPLGMTLSEQMGLTLDLDKRPSKQKRARTFAVSVPNDVRTALTPSAGLAAYESVLHEAGHALSFTRSTAADFEMKVLGDQTLSYAYGFLLQNLVGNPEWQKTHFTRIAPKEQAALARYIAWRRLALARRYAAKVMFEVAWHGAQPGDLALLYQNLMSRAHGFRLDEIDAKRWLVDHEPFFLSAQFLRAWFLSAQIEKKLVADYGQRWFEKREAGDWLTTLFKRGLEPTADEITKELGNTRVDGGALLDMIKAQL